MRPHVAPPLPGAAQRASASRDKYLSEQFFLLVIVGNRGCDSTNGTLLGAKVGESPMSTLLGKQLVFPHEVRLHEFS